MRVTIEELSRLIDGEVSDEERRDIEGRLAACPASRAMQEALRTFSQIFVEALLAAPLPPAAATSSCLAEETIIRLLDGDLSESEKAAAEEHLAACAFCLQTVMRNLRVSLRLHAGGWPEVPKERITETAILIQAQAPPAQEEWQILRIVLARQPEVSRAFTAKSVIATVTLSRLDEAHVRLAVEAKERQRPWSRQNVSLINRQNRRKHFSGLTDNSGSIEISRLPLGAYDLHFGHTGLKVEIRIEQQDEAEDKQSKHERR